MPFTSDLSGFNVIGDDNWQSVVTPDGDGLVPRDYGAEPHGSIAYAAPFNSPLIPRSEWREMIEERERKKMRIFDLMAQAGLTPLHQGSTNYCWINGVVHCVEILRVVQGQELIRLSPASCGGPITGYRNVGGWGSQGLKYVSENGIVPQSMWPANAIDRRYDTPETRAVRQNFRCDQWWDLRPRNFEQLVTCLLLGFPVSTAFNWWRHLVTAIDPVLMPDGSVGILTSNSGLGRDRNGYTVLSGSKAVPDEQIALQTVTASNPNLR